VAQVNDLSRNLTAFDPISTLVVVVEMSKASWLVDRSRASGQTGQTQEMASAVRAGALGMG
jgi:phenylpyruvate tautomerase PptA (4-oxalocrotonate tautomerase family)